MAAPLAVLGLVPVSAGSDDAAITTIKHDRAGRVRSDELLAREWHRR